MKPFADYVLTASRTVALILACGHLANAYPNQQPRQTAQGTISPQTAVTIDRVWGGTALGFDALQHANSIYLAYYNDERWLTVAKYDVLTGTLEKKVLPSRSDGWNAHKYLTIAMDRLGNLHLVGNVHASPLVYARTLRPHDLRSLQLVNRMTGSDEERVTYPRFLTFPSGDLGFSYRSGGSGNAVELINRLSGATWQRQVAGPIFASDESGPRVSAYHSGYVLGPDGFFHVAWVWRLSPNADTNFDVLYAKSQDLRKWLSSAGAVKGLPMTPATSEVVDRISPGSGLMNNVRVGFDSSSNPVISYVKYDAKGFSQLYHARLAAGSWQISTPTRWRYRWQLGHVGTLAEDISFSGLRVTPRGRLLEDVRHVMHGNLSIELHRETLSLVSQEPVTRIEDKPPFFFPEKGYMPMKRSVRPTSPGSKKSGEIRWHALPADNFDKPRCDLAAKVNCSFSSDLVLVLDR